MNTLFTEMMEKIHNSIEKEFMLALLRAFDNNKSELARFLKKDRSNLHRILRKHDIAAPMVPGDQYYEMFMKQKETIGHHKTLKLRKLDKSKRSE